MPGGSVPGGSVPKDAGGSDRTDVLAAVDHEDLAGDVVRVVAEQERDRRRDVGLGIADVSQGRLLLDLLERVGLGDGSAAQRVTHGIRPVRIDPDAVGAPLACRDPRDRHRRALAGDVRRAREDPLQR